MYVLHKALGLIFRLLDRIPLLFVQKKKHFLCVKDPPIQYVYRGRIPGRNWDKSFPPCYSQSTLLTDFTENSQEYAQKPQQNFTFMNSALEQLWQKFSPVILEVSFKAKLVTL
jgi:hypothetical protein